MLLSLTIDQDNAAGDDGDDEAARLDPVQGAVLLQGLAAATSLTRLYIGGPIVREGLQLCASLTALAQLQMLTMRNASI
jgi:hypothetical protein